VRVIKRYPNRKLYDTEDKRYITLEGIAKLIRQGEEIQVVDYTTKEDLTPLTLTQIIFEQEKKREGFLPQTVLTALIRSRGEALSGSRRTLVFPLDLLHQVDREIERRVRVLINRGELDRREGLRLRDKLLALSRGPAGMAWSSEQSLERVLARWGVPTRDDFQQLIEQLEVLETQLDSCILRRQYHD